ncbi:MAG: TIGR02646 family protein [bacterium]|nr:TIGR02646 family protein [bacterium]
MKLILKKTEPHSLREYRSTPGANYEDYRDKDDLRQSLLDEQGDICCYCMQRIKNDSMKIEHWKSQSGFSEYQLQYNNMLGACQGNEGNPGNLQHCDTRKGDTDITINPLDKNCENCENLVKYRKNGEIYSDDEEICNDLDITLNLNNQTLVQNRKKTLDIALDHMKKKYPSGTWTKEILKKEIALWNDLSEKYRPYCRIVLYDLEKRLSRAV